MRDDPEQLPYYDDEDVLTSSTKYHRPSCYMVSKVRPRNLKRLKSWRSAVKLGLEPCGICVPPRAAVPTPDQLKARNARLKAAALDTAPTLEQLRAAKAANAPPPAAPASLPVVDVGTGRAKESPEAEQIADNERPIAESQQPAVQRLMEHIAASFLVELGKKLAEQPIAEQIGEDTKPKESTPPPPPSATPTVAPQHDEAIQGAPNGATQQGTVTAPAATIRVSQLAIADVLDWRRRIDRAIKRLDQTGDRPPSEGLAAHIARLSRTGVTPRLIANMMLTITEMRNAVEHESKTLSEAENQAAWQNWRVIQDWASKEGMQI
jgi:hypothetical protein